MQTFPTFNYANIKLGAEAEVGPREDITQAMVDLKKVVNDAFLAMNAGSPDDYSSIPGHPMNTEQKPAADFVGFGVSQTVSQIIKEISECKEVSVKNSRGVETGLKAYEQYVKVYEQEFPQIREAYENQLNKINQSQRV